MKGLWNLPPRLEKAAEARCVAGKYSMEALKDMCDTVKLKPGLH